ncbi:MAG: PspC domain-containing protein, partial [Tannerella sp.]|nr:PspC domain-containing protein [Tannerella sp.]
MKKTVTVSLNGRVFTMDEDAYQLLDIYLQNLRSYFEKEEGATEILADFEARIEELLSEKLQSGRTVVAFVEIEEVIARVGKPADFATADEAETPPAAPETKNTRKKLFRNMHDKIVGGVCSGLAAYFGWDATWVRLAFVVLAFIPAGLTKVVYHIVPGGAHSSSFSMSFLIIAYVIAWIVVPKAKTAEEKLQMRGEPVTVENIGKTVSAQAAPPTSQSNNNGCLSGGLSVLGALLKVSLIVIGLLVVIPLLFALGIVVVVLFGVLFGVTGGLLGGLGSELIGESSFFAINRPVLAIVSLVLILGIPSAAMIYWVVAKIAKLKPVSLLFKRISLAIWLVALALLCCSGIHFNKNNWMKGQRWKNGTFLWNKASYEVYDANDANDKSEPIEGSGRQGERQVDFDGAVSTLRLGKHLIAKVQIEQTDSGKTTLFYSGDENFVKNIREDLKDNRL